MRITTIASGSRGNCYLLHNDKECLVIEAGIPFKKILPHINFNPKIIKGVLVSHEHGDHAKYIKEYTDKYIDVYAPYKVADSINNIGLKPLMPSITYRIGNFSVVPMDVPHDSIQCFSYIITHKETGKVMFATDLQNYPYTNTDLTTIMIECNYIEGILMDNLQDGVIDTKQYERLRHAHLGLKGCLDAIEVQGKEKLQDIILIHLSSRNANSEIMQNIVQNKYKVRTTTAKPNITICLNPLDL